MVLEHPLGYVCADKIFFRASLSQCAKTHTHTQTVCRQYRQCCTGCTDVIRYRFANFTALPNSLGPKNAQTERIRSSQVRRAVSFEHKKLEGVSHHSYLGSNETVRWNRFDRVRFFRVVRIRENLQAFDKKKRVGSCEAALLKSVPTVHTVLCACRVCMFRAVRCEKEAGNVQYRQHRTALCIRWDVKKIRTTCSFALPILSIRVYTIRLPTLPRNSVADPYYSRRCSSYCQQKSNTPCKRAIVPVPSYCSVCISVLNSCSMQQAWGGR